MPSSSVVVVGLGLRLPSGVRSLDDHAAVLTVGRPLAGPPPASRAGELGRERAAAWLDDAGAVEAGALRLDEDTARWLDPSARLLLACARDALESGGVRGRRLDCGVFVGVGESGWGTRSLYGGHAGAPGAGLGSLPGMLATRLAYHLDLAGPVVALDAACASALVAVATAADAVAAGTCRLALAGGAAALVSAEQDAWLRALGVLSGGEVPRPFAERGDGYVRGEGGGLLLLAREDDARAKGWPVLARITGTGLSGGGRTQGMGAPTPTAHAEAASRALARAGRGVAYVEAGGLGLPLADRVEVEGLARAYAGAPVALGTARVVYGHLEHASGVVGLATALLVLREGELPPTPPPVDAVALPAPLTWSTPGMRLPSGARVAVHGAGLNGTVAHVVLAAGDGRPGPLPPLGSTVSPWLPPAGRGSDPRQGTLEERLAAVIQDVFNLAEPPRPDTPLSWQGLDSLGLVALRQRIEEDFGVALGQGDVSEASSLRELAALLRPDAGRVVLPAGVALGLGLALGLAAGFLLGASW